ncbi:MAG TPA: SRPBCC family protein, partial [Phycisphaerales bacterium]|nr:SRPBCC family protein [Phycisphaerales bacterium]
MKMWLLYAALILVGLLLLAAGTLGVLGRFLPKEHTSSGSVDLTATQEQVYALINDIGAFPDWCKDFTRMERLPDHVGPDNEKKEQWRQYMGRNSFTSVNELMEPPRRVVRRVDDDNRLFGGTWDHVIEPTGPSTCRLTITEKGHVNSDIPRAMMHYIIGEDYTIKKFLKAVKAKT